MMEPEQAAGSRFPASAGDMELAEATPLVGRYPGWRGDPGDLPGGLSLQWHVHPS